MHFKLIFFFTIREDVSPKKKKTRIKSRFHSGFYWLKKCFVSEWAWPAEERKCRWDVRRTLKKKKDIKGAEHEPKVTDASNPMNVARGILVLIFCTLFIASYFTNKVNWLYYTFGQHQCVFVLLFLDCMYKNVCIF